MSTSGWSYTTAHLSHMHMVSLDVNIRNSVCDEVPTFFSFFLSDWLSLAVIANAKSVPLSTSERDQVIMELIHQPLSASCSLLIFCLSVRSCILHLHGHPRATHGQHQSDYFHLVKTRHTWTASCCLCGRAILDTIWTWFCRRCLELVKIKCFLWYDFHTM